MLGTLRPILAALTFALSLYALPASASLPVAPVLPTPKPIFAPTLAIEPIDDDAAMASELAVGSDESAAALMPGLAEFAAQVADLNGVALDSDMDCLARAIYFEARGESVEGQLAVAQVVLNRAASAHYAGSICDVVYAPKQFSFTSDGRPDTIAEPDEAWRRAEAVAIIAATRSWQDVTDRALYFHATYVAPSWRHAKEETRQIGRHIFYR